MSTPQRILRKERFEHAPVFAVTKPVDLPRLLEKMAALGITAA